MSPFFNMQKQKLNLKTKNLLNYNINPFSWIELSKENFFHNINILKKHIGNKTLSLVVKANAYGHGLLQVAQMAEENSTIECLCTFKTSEALFLRQNNIKKPILNLGVIDSIYEDIIKNNIELTIFDNFTALQINNIAEKLNLKINIHLKIDTGLSRLGFLYNDLNSIKKICRLKNLETKGIFSHFSEADAPEEEFSKIQIQRLLNLINELEKENIKIKYKHIESSSAAIRFTNLIDFNFVRIGGAAYGLKKEFIKENFPINTKPIFSWKSKILSIKNIPKDSYVSYSRTYQVKEDTKIGIIPVGYSDGYDRKLSNNSYVVIKDKKAEILGRVCMNMIIVNLNNIDCKIEDEVIIMDNNSELSADLIASKLNTINYELLTRINSDIIRVIK